MKACGITVVESPASIGITMKNLLEGKGEKAKGPKSEPVKAAVKKPAAKKVAKKK
jgi:hypothetical protein